MICIDYCPVPPAFSIIPLAEYEQHLPELNGSANDLERNDVVLSRAREHPEQATLIQSRIANGEGIQIVLTRTRWRTVVVERRGAEEAKNEVL